MREYQGQAFADASDLLQTRRSVCMRRTQKNWNGRIETERMETFLTSTVPIHVHVHVYTCLAADGWT